MTKPSGNDYDINYSLMNRNSNLIDTKYHKHRKNTVGFSQNNLFKWLNFRKNRKYIRRRFLIFLFAVN